MFAQPLKTVRVKTTGEDNACPAINSYRGKTTVKIMLAQPLIAIGVKRQ